MFSFLNRSPRRRKVICIGLDGAPYTVIRSLIDRGVMPHLASICRTGVLAQMDTTIPDVSAVAWSSFLTGVNPGKHGLYGFYDLHPQSYRLRFPQLPDLQAPLLWDLMPEKKTCAFNIPSTYPARKLNGMMVSGFVAPDLDKSVYPAQLLEELRRNNYRLDVNTSLAKTDPGRAAVPAGRQGCQLDALAADLLATHRQHRQVLIDLLRRRDWDLFIGVMTATDRLQHFYMDAYADEHHAHHDLFMNVYRDADETLGEIFAEKDEDTLMLILSDHGFCCLKKEVNLNAVLRANGYLGVDGDEFSDLRPETRAFCLTPGRIYLHYQDTYGRGSVKRPDAGKIIEELTGLFTGLDDNGKKVIQSIHRRDDLYRGPRRNLAPGTTGQAPDLVLMPAAGYDLKGAPGPKPVFSGSHFRGMHTRDDAMLFVSKQIKKPRPQILDVTATIAGYLTEKVPAEMDGDNLL